MPDQVKRLLVAFVFFLALFFLLRYLLIPASFGELGHYRAGAIDDEMAYQTKHAGNEACKKCHEEEVEELSYGFHAGLSCEGCHGPALRHASYSESADPDNYPDSLRLSRPMEREHCARCHDLNPSRIKLSSDSTDFSMVRMVDVKEHNHFIYEETNEIIRCVECHYSHSP
ncbi:MAG: hypothetical protein ISR57_01350 [Bacteroidales bacterium]|nr:hypothetical protein [Bacteroidota bacterium]MBL6949266.1 hypothetical protein [Bacteroidales bacterium]